jgi:hypothetical protein
MQILEVEKGPELGLLGKVVFLGEFNGEGGRWVSSQWRRNGGWYKGHGARVCYDWLSEGRIVAAVAAIRKEKRG